MIEIAARLKNLCDKASFTDTDMAIWCECDRSAMREWMHNDVKPHPIKKKHLEARLDILDMTLEKSTKLPVPIQIKQYQRRSYVEGVRNYAVGKFSKTCAAKRGLQMLGAAK